jgi:hypothetical protein
MTQSNSAQTAEEAATDFLSANEKMPDRFPGGNA